MISKVNQSTIGNDCNSNRNTLNNIPIKNNERWCLNFFGCFISFTRFWGMFTAIVLCGVGVDLAFHRHKTGYYLIGCSVLLLLLELTWVITLFLQLCVRSDSNIFHCWSYVTWLEGWKKTLLYIPMGTVPLIWPHNLWLSYVVSGQLFGLALFHLVASFKDRKRKKRRDRLLHGEIDSFESSKFEEVTEVLDDSLPEPIPGSSHSISDSLVEQDTIHEI